MLSSVHRGLMRTRSVVVVANPTLYQLTISGIKNGLNSADNGNGVMPSSFSTDKIGPVG